MKVTNLTQGFLFPVAHLVGDGPDTITRLENESDDDYAKRSAELREKMAEATTNKTEDVSELQAALSPKALADYLALGARLPSDMITVEMSVGSLVFDLYQSTAVPPKAPLAVALFSKRVQKMATDSQKEEFELDDSLLAQLRKPLEDETLWNTLDLTLTTTVAGQKVFFRVNHNAAMYFPKVLEAALTLFIPE